MNAGIAPPYPNFTNPSVQTSRTVAQALRPYPQYQTVNVQTGGGDKSGTSHYHAGVVKVNQRMSGLLLQGSYTYSKLMTDADSFSGSSGSMDTARPELEWSVGGFDQTHSIKVNTVYDLPFGEGRRWLQSGIASHVLGGWRVALIQFYSSGFPIGVTTNAPLNIFNFANRPNVTGADWRAPIAGDEFDPTVDRFLNRAAFVQPVGQLGNAPRPNADVRRPWNLTENISVAKSIGITQDDGHRHPHRGLQPVQPRRLERAEYRFQQQQLRPDHEHGEYAAADAARPEAVLVGRSFSSAALEGVEVCARRT